ncbi:MAG TPA: glycosyltransferase [Bacteroidia bacterium]|nr:glycosyltransferase [Bacteroidia bacterium]
MEIIHLILGKANPQRMNGVNKVVHQLATHQSLLGHYVQVWGITPSPEGEYPDRNYDTRLFQSLKNKFRIDQHLSKAIRECPKETVFHLHGGFIPEFYHAVRLLTATGHEFVFTPHGSYNAIAMQKNHLVKSVYFPLIEKSVVSAAKLVHFLGKTEYEAMDDLLPGTNKVLIPNGQDMNELKFIYSPLPKTKGTVFGFCGRLTAYTKGLDLMLEAFSRFVHHDGLEGELWLIGDGEDRALLEQRARELNIHERVTFFGACFGEEKLNLIANMDVFLHPSRNEGLPMSVLEASALKVPCIVSEETNMASYIREFDAGIALPANTPWDIYRAMKTAVIEISEKKWEQKRIQARKMVQSAFDWHRIAEKLIRVYAA